MFQAHYRLDKSIFATIAICSLGYFVDIYDLILFSIVRMQSLQDIGIQGPAALEQGVYLLNMQMGGMLLGGLAWGILGDKRGRVSVLFASILIYSLANFLNAFVSSIEQYAALRFIAGLGLSGELGLAITLVSEVMPKETRGYGTSFVAAIGILGALAAGFIGDLLSWRAAYVIGGVLGFLLLILRLQMLESTYFNQVKQMPVARGDLRMLFNSFERFKRYAASIMIGMPNWFVIGVLMTFAPEIAAEMQVQTPIAAGTAIMSCYFGLSVGDFASGWISQLVGSRKKVVCLFLIVKSILIATYLFAGPISASRFYCLCFLLGISAGYWALFVTIAAEQFGTNLRSTVATTVPNFVRGAVIPITLAFQFCRQYYGLAGGALIVGLVCLAIAFGGLMIIQETFGRDLGFLEADG